MGDMIEFGLFMGILTVAGLAFRFSGVLIKRLERSNERPPALDEMEQRLADLEELVDQRDHESEQRILELEERLDFAERLLSRPKDKTPT